MGKAANLPSGTFGEQTCHLCRGRSLKTWRCPDLFPMGSAVKLACGAPAKQLLCCISADFPRDKDSSVPRFPSKDRGQQQHQRVVISQKHTSKRDAVFVQRKAERAAMRAELREKYQLPKSRIDKKQMRAAKGNKNLLAIVKSKDTSDTSSFFPSFSGLDFSSFRMTAQNAMQSLPRPVQCPVM